MLKILRENLILEELNVVHTKQYDEYTYYVVPKYRVYFQLNDDQYDYDLYDSIDQAEEDFNRLSIDDFEGDNTSQNVTLYLDKTYVVYESDTDSVEDAVESDQTLYDIDLEDDYYPDTIEYRQIEGDNGEKCVDLRLDIDLYLNKKYYRTMGKYKYIHFDSKGKILTFREYNLMDEDETYSLLIRLSDHSRNTQNDTQNDFDVMLSFVIADDDKTAAKFHGDDIQFTCEMDWSYITKEIDEEIEIAIYSVTKDLN